MAVKLLNDKLRRHLPMPLPGELLTVCILGAGARGRGGSVPVGIPRHVRASGVGTGESAWREGPTESPRWYLPPTPDSALSPQLIGATGISYGVGLKHRFGVDVVGEIPTG